MFQYARNVKINGGAFTVVNEQIQQNGMTGLQILHRWVSDGAAHDSAQHAPVCHPDTRKTIIGDIMGWIGDPSRKSSVLWFNGPAGAGKTAIGQSLCKRCEAAKWLAGSFFFSRHDPGRSNAKFLFPTISFALSLAIPDVGKIIDEVVANDPSIPTKALEIQLQKLILEPLQQVSEKSKQPIVIIIDGLDECEGEEVQSNVLRLLGSVFQRPSVGGCDRIRFIVTSRPEPWIRDEFTIEPLSSITRQIFLGQTPEANDDIRTFFRLGFTEIHDSPKHRLTMSSVAMPWPSSRVLDDLVDKASGQFIYPATVLKFVGDPDYRPTDRLDIITLIPVISPSALAFKPQVSLDQLFSQIPPTSPDKQRSLDILCALIAMQATTSRRHVESDAFHEDLLRIAEKLLDLQPGDGRTHESHRTHVTQQSKFSQGSKDTYRSNGRSSTPEPRPPLINGQGLYPTDSLARSTFQRFNELVSIRVKPDTTERLQDMRRLMIKDKLDYYIVPSEDAHHSEWVTASDKRLEFISGFTGTAGHAIVSMHSAFLLTDSRYWLQTQEEIDGNWTLVKAGSLEEPQDWIEWIASQAGSSRIGIDARMISHEKATLLNSKLGSIESKLVFSPQNLVDLIWKAKPVKPDAAMYIQNIEFAGRTADHKLAKLREWIQQQPPSAPSYLKETTPIRQYTQVATLVTSLTCIAYILNLRGSDTPYNPLFHAYLFVGLESAVLFVEKSKVDDDVASYLKEINVQLRSYTDLWPFLRRREWGEGKVLIAPQTSYAISLMLTHFRFTLAPSYIEHMMSIKNETEIDGMRRAYLRDGVSFVKFLAWLDNKLSQGYEITEYEAAFRLTEYRRGNKHFMGLSYENISASGPNSALPHYSPRKSTAQMIMRDAPYLNDSGAQYYDGTCDTTTRTVHFGRPTPDMSEAYTRVLQGHITIDTAIFPEGTSDRQLDVLARKALWKDEMIYMNGTGHGFGTIGAFLSVHKVTHNGVSSDIPLAPGHVITNGPSFYLNGKWGMSIESALSVRKVKIRGEFNGTTWLGFERLTCVPIQTRMVKKDMLTKEEKTWLKDHNQQCYDRISPFLKEDKRALTWLKREAQ